MKNRFVLVSALVVAFAFPVASNASLAGAVSLPVSEVQPETVPAVLLKAEQGDGDAMYRLALIYERGTNGAKIDQREMLKWLHLSAQLGNGMASYKLFTYYASQPTGYASAIKYWNLSQQQGYCKPATIGNVRGKYPIQRCAMG